jgi:hypothetical protein
MTTVLVAAERNSKSAMGNDKKDLTGILDLQRLQAEDPSAVAANTEQDPFAVNELQPIEQVDSFESLDQIGMMDHPTEEPLQETPQESPELSLEPVSDPFAETVSEPVADTTIDWSEEPAVESPIEQAPLESAPSWTPEPVAPTAAPTPLADTLSYQSSDATDYQDPIFDSVKPSQSNVSTPTSSIQQMRAYSEKTSGNTGIATKIFYPFHLKIQGKFGPFERDKLLLFISENPIGLTSAELDLQIQSSRVFFPRISEFSAIKLIQELRDSGLHFQLHPSDREESISTRETPHRFHYQNPRDEGHGDLAHEIPILNANSQPDANFQQLDEVSVTQFVSMEMVEVENSPIINEVVERMTEALKQKARLKGGNALMHLKKEITPLRLPSQYQISLKANVIRLP